LLTAISAIKSVIKKKNNNNNNNTGCYLFKWVLNQFRIWDLWQTHQVLVIVCSWREMFQNWLLPRSVNSEISIQTFIFLFTKNFEKTHREPSCMQTIALQSRRYVTCRRDLHVNSIISEIRDWDYNLADVIENAYGLDVSLSLHSI
jgi:hypothetical protein